MGRRPGDAGKVERNSQRAGAGLAPLRTAGGRKLIVEQHQGIYACTQEEIVLRTQCGLMSITGENLSLSRYDRDGLVVLGKIEKLSYRPKG